MASGEQTLIKKLKEIAMNKHNDPIEKELEEFKEKYAKLIEKNSEEPEEKPKGILNRFKAWVKKIAENLIIKF